MQGQPQNSQCCATARAKIIVGNLAVNEQNIYKHESISQLIWNAY